MTTGSTSLSGLSWWDDVKGAAKSFGEDTLGLSADYLSGGVPALANDWWEGFNSMSTEGKVADLALPAAPIAALGGAEIGGVGGAVVWGADTLGAEAPEVENLLEGGGADLCPSDLNNTIERIQAGEQLDYTHDATVFENREGLLPDRPLGYYTEYVHPTEGVEGPGAQRIVTGANGEIYYSPDHYNTFIPLDLP